MPSPCSNCVQTGLPNPGNSVSFGAAYRLSCRHLLGLGPGAVVEEWISPLFFATRRDCSRSNRPGVNRGRPDLASSQARNSLQDVFVDHFIFLCIFYCLCLFLFKINRGGIDVPDLMILMDNGTRPSQPGKLCFLHLNRGLSFAIIHAGEVLHEALRGERQLRTTTTPGRGSRCFAYHYRAAHN